jgi:hypothetical protein
MKLIRGMVLLLAVCLPTTWTLAHAEDGAAGTGGEVKPKKKGKKKKDAGSMGDAKKDDMK